MHVLRRNLDCQILLFNNEIYGLTKGQYSPTSRAGTRSPSTPFGSVDRPASPCAFAQGSGARFIARGIDTHKKLPDVLKAAYDHRGASFVEIFQNCIVYNDDVFAGFTDRKTGPEHQLWLEHGEPMLFANGTKGLALDRTDLRLHVVDVVDGAWEAAGVIRHDQTNPGLTRMLIDLSPERGQPMALGVLYNDPRPTYDSAVVAQNAEVANGRKGDLQALIAKGQTWQVDKQQPHEI
jgi:2-oxoglutarate ferredoxin oxidoreductase subunit beta